MDQMCKVNIIIFPLWQLYLENSGLIRFPLRS